LHTRIHAVIAAALLTAATLAGAASAPTEFAYGAAPLQKLDFWHAATGQSAPLIVFVHGGSWERGDKASATGMQKVAHWTGEGFAFASVNYRLVPGATAEQQATDVAVATAWLRAHAAGMGFDPARIVLMGHSAGAQLVALVGTDAHYLAAAGMAPSDLRGVITLDGAAYDVPRQVDGAGPLMRHIYHDTFGNDPVRQRALSATLHAHDATSAPAFLLIHIDRPDSKAQAEELAAALTQAGTPAQVAAVGGNGLRGHLDLNTSLGSSDAPATAIVDTWLRQRLPAN
jgi:arylformamidase